MSSTFSQNFGKYLSSKAFLDLLIHKKLMLYFAFDMTFHGLYFDILDPITVLTFWWVLILKNVDDF